MFIHLLLFLPLTIAAQNSADTIYRTVPAEISYCSTLDSLGFDKMKVIYESQRPKGYLYQSSNKSDGGKYRFAIQKGKKWKTWLTGISNPDKGQLKVNRKDVDDVLQPDLIIWEMKVSGIQSELQDQKMLNYTVHIWNIETATQLFLFNYRSFDSKDMNLKDSVPATVSGFSYEITISNNQILIDKFQDHSVYADSSSAIPAMTAVTGTYRYAEGKWVKSSKPFESKTVEIAQPHFQPYWEKQTDVPRPKMKDRFKEWIKKRRFGNRKK